MLLTRVYAVSCWRHADCGEFEVHANALGKLQHYADLVFCCMFQSGTKVSWPQSLQCFFLFLMMTSRLVPQQVTVPTLGMCWVSPCSGLDFVS